MKSPYFYISTLISTTVKSRLCTVQLCYITGNFEEALKLFHDCGGHQPTSDELLLALKRGLSGRIFLVFDGLDKCVEEANFWTFLSHFTEASTRVLITTRGPAMDELTEYSLINIQ